MAGSGAPGANPDGAGPCVAVVGMGRSGTSATAGLLVNLGLSGPRPDDLVPPTKSNERGHWESRAVVRCNARLLRAVGSSGHCPPPVMLDWSGVDGYAVQRADALRWFRANDAGRPMMVKDPRMCMTLSFWREVVPVPMAAVFVLREPVRVARSLQARDRLPVSLGLALWDRYVRAAMIGLTGLPVLVVHYDEMVADRAAGTARVAAFLDGLGVAVDPAAADAASTWFDPNLRHQRSTTDDYADTASVQRALFTQLIGGPDFHPVWEPPPVPDPPAWVDDVIALRRQLQNTRRQLRGIQGTRAYRTARSLKRLAHLGR